MSSGEASDNSTVILFLAANPKGKYQLRLDEEMREIQAGLERSKKREQFDLQQRWAVRSEDVRRATLDLNPRIVHFSGHGEAVEDASGKLVKEGLFLEDETGQAKLVSTSALSGLFELYADCVECVLLNACYSEVQAEAIAKHINYVIGMSQAINDKAAIEFAIGFYDALGAGESIERSYRIACNAIEMAGIRQQDIPQLKKNPTLKPFPSHSQYIPSAKTPSKNGFNNLLMRGLTVLLVGASGYGFWWSSHRNVVSSPQKIIPTSVASTTLAEESKSSQCGKLFAVVNEVSFAWSLTDPTKLSHEPAAMAEAFGTYEEILNRGVSKLEALQLSDEKVINFRTRHISLFNQASKTFRALRAAVIEKTQASSEEAQKVMDEYDARTPLMDSLIGEANTYCAPLRLGS